MNYVERFEKMGFGMFVHFGLYSIVGKGEWYLKLNPKADHAKYRQLPKRFVVKRGWAKELVKTAKSAGCRYITITTRHHDGFSLFDTCGMNEYDAPHSACGRDLIREFVDACNEEGIVPFFYHTLLDWWKEEFYTDFPAYIDYLVKSVELLCTRYGKIGGFWFDGMWSKSDENWQEDRLYGMIRKHQPEAMIINNTGISALGKVGHPEIDSVTFERGNPCFVDNSDKHRAGEMCQVLNDHWGYTANDCNYKSVATLIENLVDCRKFNCNFLLNVGLRGNGSVSPMDKAMLGEIGKWVKKNKGFIYGVRAAEIEADGADILVGDDGAYYAVIKNVGMSADPNVALNKSEGNIRIHAPVKSAVWLDNGRRIKIKKGEFAVVPFAYGESYAVRVAKFTLE